MVVDPAAETRARGDGPGEGLPGRVLACFHDEWEVALDSGDVVRASIRARHFVRLSKDEKVLIAGDFVRVSVATGGAYVIEERLPRCTTLSRLLPGAKQEREQAIVANAEQLVAIAALCDPPLNRRMLDRFLVIAEDADLKSVVVLNKTDLVPAADWQAVADVYRRAGYAVVPTSAVYMSGVNQIANQVKQRFSVL